VNVFGNTPMHIDSWLLKVLVGLVSGLLVQLSVFLVKNAYKLIQKVIKLAQEGQKVQKVQQVDLLNSYVDLEELLGDFLEKYRGLLQKTPPLSRWEFFYAMVADVIGLVKGLVEIAVKRFFD